LTRFVVFVLVVGAFQFLALGAEAFRIVLPPLATAPAREHLQRRPSFAGRTLMSPGLSLYP